MMLPPTYTANAGVGPIAAADTFADTDADAAFAYAADADVAFAYDADVADLVFFYGGNKQHLILIFLSILAFLSKLIFYHY